MQQVALIVALSCLVMVAAFQLALAMGAPWGHLAMGGRFPGRYPPTMRLVALLMIPLYGFLGLILAVRSSILLPEWRASASVAAWVVVAVFAFSVAANLATPSKWERRLWAPVAIALAVSSFVIALG